MSEMVKFVIVPLAGLSLASAAPAAVIAFGGSGSANASTNATGLPLQAAIAISKFDPTLGRLDSVTIGYSFAVGLSASLFNFGPGTLNATFRVNPAVLTLRDAGGSTIASGAPQALYSIHAGPFGSDSINTTTSAVTGTLAPLTSNAALTDFVGTDPYVFTYYGDPNVVAMGASPNVRVLYGVTVTYDYTLTEDIPEPASWAMMLAGFGAIGASIRRRKSLAATA
jgi:hypothetical protein